MLFSTKFVPTGACSLEPLMIFFSRLFIDYLMNNILCAQGGKNCSIWTCTDILPSPKEVAFTKRRQVHVTEF